VDISDLEVIGGDRVREEQGLAIVEAHAVLPRITREDRDDRVLRRGAATHLLGVLFARREVQEVTTSRAQAAPCSAVSVAAAHAEVELLRRLSRLARVNLDRVSIQSADLAVDDLVARTITGLDGLCHFLLFDVLVELFTERVQDVLEVGVSELVDLYVELLRLVPKHVGEFAGQTLVIVVLAHGCSGAY
jgi:hypothetical protein